MTDGCSAQVAAGVTTPGSWNSVLGTTLVLKGVSPHLVQDPLGVVYCHRGPEETWLPGGASSSGAGVVSRDFPDADLDALSDEAARRPPQAVTYPIVSGSGERFPFRAPSATTITVGDVAGVLDEFNARLVGVACVERLCLDYLDLLGAPTDGEIRTTGGGSRNDHWCQLRSDLLGRELVRPERAETARGMAVLAATSTGLPLAEVAKQMVPAGTVFAPRPQGGLTQLYLALLDEQATRGWLTDHVHQHARQRVDP
jgi:sugar (pentulose or hexulose) kinase